MAASKTIDQIAALMPLLDDSVKAPYSKILCADLGFAPYSKILCADLGFATL